MEILYNTVVGLIRPLSSSVKYKSISESATINRDNDDNPTINLKKKSTKKMKKNKKKKKGKNDLIQIFVTVPDGHVSTDVIDAILMNLIVIKMNKHDDDDQIWVMGKKEKIKIEKWNYSELNYFFSNSYYYQTKHSTLNTF